MRVPTTAAPVPYRGVGIGSLAIQRLPATSYISLALKIRSGASPPKTKMRSGSATAVSPPRPVGSASPVRQESVAGS